MPTNSLTKSLSAYNVCNHDGYPLTKITWIQWDDIQIIRYFETMYDDYYWNYNGVINYKMTLTYLSYIIRYSCAKTLAFKHKRSLRFILEYNDNYRRFIQFHRLRENQVFLRRLWHLDI
jgi:Type II intron maturase